VTLDDWISAYACRRIDGFLRRHEGAPARRIVFQAVIATHHAIAFETALRKRHQPMPAGIFQRRHLSVGLPIDDNVLAADRPRKQRVLDIDIPCGGVPGINREGLGHGITSVRAFCIPYINVESAHQSSSSANGAAEWPPDDRLRRMIQ
jgi:hypothetical protein